MTRESRIWTAGDYAAGYERSTGIDRAILFLHRPHAGHCGGYDVLAWPCPPAKQVLAKVAEEGRA